MSRSASRLSLALGGGAARGLAHIGVLAVLEREGIRADCIAGSSMGALIGALSASGLRAPEILAAARHFRFPRLFVLGRTLRWDDLFPSAARVLEGRTFQDLDRRLLITTVDLEVGCQIVQDGGSVLPAVRASCAVPGILPPVKLQGRWLVDGSLVNPVPIDVAWMAEADVVMAVNVGGLKTCSMPQLEGRMASAFTRLGRFLPNPATARFSFEMLARASEIALARQTTLATAMTGPEVVVEPRLKGLGLRDFHRLDDAFEAGRRATEAILPELRRVLEAPTRRAAGPQTFHVDPVCRMVVSPHRARARATYLAGTYYFCSANCRDCFVRAPARYVSEPIIAGASDAGAR